MTVIRGLKQEIGRLKNTMESPDYGIEPIMHPSGNTCFHWTREHLERAKQAYAEAGWTYTLSKSEESAANFDANMDAICKITFSIGEWVIDKENDGMPEHPIQMPFVGYSEMVYNFIDDVYTFEESNKDMELTRYGDILKDNGLEWGYGIYEEY